MFIITAKFEDLNLIATSNNGDNYKVTLADDVTGKHEEHTVSHEELSAIMQFNLHPEGTPHESEQLYQTLEGLLSKLPPELRPVP